MFVDSNLIYLYLAVNSAVNNKYVLVNEYVSTHIRNQITVAYYLNFLKIESSATHSNFISIGLHVFWIYQCSLRRKDVVSEHWLFIALFVYTLKTIFCFFSLCYCYVVYIIYYTLYYAVTLVISQYFTT